MACRKLAVAVLLILCGAMMAIAGTDAGGPSGLPIAHTAAGEVSGVPVDGVLAFKGIPFAAPPVGELRFRPPRPVEPWRGVRAAAEYGPACVQMGASGAGARISSSYSEDCLQLNVWTPAADGAARLPVMVWFHGGGFAVGSAADDLYDGRYLAAKGAVVVTVNYRLGPIGFLAYPLLGAESAHGVSGNYGLLDMIAALEWVRDNIVSFGGDPGRVTIFGESAGGRCVAHLMATPAARGLFHRAIMQSSSLYRPLNHLRQPYYGRPAAEEIGRRVAAKLGCADADDPLACLRAVAADDLVAASGAAMGSDPDGHHFEPIVDGWLLADDPSQIFEDGGQLRVPVIAGSNADESTVFTPRGLFSTAEQVRDAAEKMFPGHAAEVVGLYPIVTADDAWRAASRIQGDWMFTMPILKTVRAAARTGAPAYHYFFTHARSDARGRMLGAYHGAEIRFAFANLELGSAPVSAEDRALADAMSSYWVAFAATGDPNRDELPSWPRYDPEDEPCLVLGDPIRVDHHLRPEVTAMMERLEAERRAGRAAAR